jgi:hypothetical protein
VKKTSKFLLLPLEIPSLKKCGEHMHRREIVNGGCIWERLFYRGRKWIRLD